MTGNEPSSTCTDNLPEEFELTLDLVRTAMRMEYAKNLLLHMCSKTTYPQDVAIADINNNSEALLWYHHHCWQTATSAKTHKNMCWPYQLKLVFNPLTPGAAYIRVFIFSQHIRYHVLNMLKTKSDINQSAIFENSWPPFCQSWIIFTHLKL